MEMFGKIRRMHLRDKLSLHEIPKRTGLSRNTLRKWLRMPEDAAAPTYIRGEGPGKLTEFHDALVLALNADAHRIKQNRRTAKALFIQIKADGYAGGYSRVTDFIRDWRGREGKNPHAFVPLKFDLGEAFQFDWSEEGLVIGGIYRRIQVSHLKLCASRAFWLVAYPSQGHEMLFDAHTRSFAALGGISRRGIYDNMKTAVDKVNKGKGRIVNSRFAAMCSHYLFDPDFCNRASGWEKGVVEKNVQDSRRRIWIDAQDRKFGSFMELNAWLAERCRSLWSELRHPEHGQFSVADMLEQERGQMMPMLPPFDGYAERSSRVSSTCLINVHRNHYSVPCEFAGQMVSTRLYPNRISVVAGDVVVTSHDRLIERGQVCYDWQHYIPLVQRKPGALRNGAPFADMPPPLMLLKQGLLRHAGGDKVVAQVLAAVPTAGLPAVLVAVELVIESGVLSTEHVQNAASAPGSIFNRQGGSIFNRRQHSALALFMVVAWRIAYLMRLGRTCPDLDASHFFDPDEIRGAYLLTKERRPDRPPTLNALNEVLRLIARVGGFLGRKGDGDPGVKTIWQGIQEVRVAALTIKALRDEDE